ncbi:MAG: aldo/keto reductase [Clostridiales bacterium]|jgi:predicted aldo/keto reductase-like oxidoreductase|nr:aldo/keto reductase [Clostridiales bacterium]
MDKNMPKLGFGAMRLPVEGRDDRIDLKQTSEMAALFLDRGFKYFDTAYVYHGGKSELALKEALVKKHPRHSYWLATKMPLWKVKVSSDLSRIFQDQLKRCEVDYFDYYLLHGLDRTSYQKAGNFNAFEFAASIKKEGRARFAGFSFHDAPSVLELILSEHPEMDFVQLQINYLDAVQSDASQLHEIALKHKTPIIVMEPVKGGVLSKLEPTADAILKALDPEASASSWALRYASSLDGVYVALSGMSNIKQLKDNINTYENFKPLSKEEKLAVESAARELGASSAVPCTACKYCLESCPENLDIPRIFSAFNSLKRHGNKQSSQAKYESIPKEQRASKCIGCGACSLRCPQRILIHEELKKAVAVFE